MGRARPGRVGADGLFSAFHLGRTVRWRRGRDDDGTSGRRAAAGGAAILDGDGHTRGGGGSLSLSLSPREEMEALIMVIQGTGQNLRTIKIWSGLTSVFGALGMSVPCDV
ncbi:hypothetical protein DAI22_04g127000 [Oryza sativa Japonica Group]|nr:hypothetical protein DAI22_04g127000 [Oryza sativa Japonica Group]